ncbi:MAG: hypothetical protein ACLR6J_08250 [Parabacteroides merdae]
MVGDKGGENSPTQDMSNAYEVGDPRKYVSMRDGWTNAKTGAWENEKYVCKHDDVSRNGIWTTITTGSNCGWLIIYLFICRSTCSYRMVIKQTAIDYVNKIRERARNTPGDPDITPAADLLRDYTLAGFPQPPTTCYWLSKKNVAWNWLSKIIAGLT